DSISITMMDIHPRDSQHQITSIQPVPMPIGSMTGMMVIGEATAVMVAIVPGLIMTRAMEGFHLNSTSTSLI
ncbi:MAG: hypothetical protein MUO68_10300, partial [Desulfobacteraceae bacterium]|nr:hypothetical protein [Desulfobacteraceae bacterium]